MVMATPSPQQVGREFVRQYYTVLHEAPDVLHRFYSSSSAFVHGGVDRPGLASEEPVIGQVEIDKKIKMLQFKDCHTKIRQVDSQATIGNGVVVQVTGELSNNGEPMRRFMQTFVLAPQTPKKFYVHNDIFRYQDEVYQDNSDSESEEHPIEQPAKLNIDYYQQNAEQQQPEPVLTTEQLQQSEMAAAKAAAAQVLLASPQMNLQEPIPAPVINGHFVDNNIQQQHLVDVEVIDQIPTVATLVTTSSEVSIVKDGRKSVELLIENQVVEQQQTPPQILEQVVVTQKDVPQQDAQTAADVKSSWAKIITNRSGTEAVNNVNTNSVSNLGNAPSQQVYHQQQQPSQPPQQQQYGLKPSSKETTKSSSNVHKSNGLSNLPSASGNGPSTKKQTRTSLSSNQQQQAQQQQPAQQIQRLSTTESANLAEDAEKRFGRYPDGQQVFVGNLNQDLSETELKQFFGQYGKVVEVRINSNTKHQSGRRLPNYGFVVFDEKQTVDALLGVNKSNNLTYKNEKGVEYRLNVEEKRARQGRMSNFGGSGTGKPNNRTARSSSNGSRGPVNGATSKKQPNQNHNAQFNNTHNNESYFEKRKDGDNSIVAEGNASHHKFNSRRS